MSAGFDADGPWLHIRSQSTYHSEATIVGTLEGLVALRDVLSEAIEKGTSEAEVFANDGEGYGVVVTRSSTVEGLGSPTYLDEEARMLADQERAYLVREERGNRGVLKRLQTERAALEALGAKPGQSEGVGS